VSKTGKASPTFIKIDAYFDLLYSMYLIPILTAPAYISVVYTVMAIAFSGTPTEIP
jgi:hypothetical protein